MERIIIVDNKKVRLRATAAVPRLYRIKFGRDIMQDVIKLKTAYLRVVGNFDAKKVTEEQAEDFFSAADLGIFENVAYIMAHHADPQNTPDTPEEWLDSFNTFSIYNVLPEILSLWIGNEQTTVDSKKKLKAVIGN